MISNLPLTGSALAMISASQRLGLTDDQMNDFNFDMLAHLGFSKDEIEHANTHVCGSMTLEGAPHLKDEHLPVFDCANPWDVLVNVS